MPHHRTWRAAFGGAVALAAVLALAPPLGPAAAAAPPPAGGAPVGAVKGVSRPPHGAPGRPVPR
ncbi:hypothetical protein AB0O33_38920, partial [Streptomyces sp. NPDC089795]